MNISFSYNKILRIKMECYKNYIFRNNVCKLTCLYSICE